MESPNNTEINIAELLSDTLEIVRREVVNLMQESACGKLPHNDSMDLIAYVKMLSSLHDKEKGILDSMSAEELQVIAKGKSKK